MGEIGGAIGTGLGAVVSLSLAGLLIKETGKLSEAALGDNILESKEFKDIDID